MVRRRVLRVAAIAALMAAVGCGKPGADGLRDSFAQQLAANQFVKDFQRNGDELTFSGPGADGEPATWRVHIDSAVVEANTDPGKPYKGTVKSSWYSDNEIVVPKGGDSNLPLELISTGLAQDCWALWDEAAQKWGWE